MTEDYTHADITVTNLLRFIEQGWNDLHAFLDTLTDHQLIIPTDAAGWTVKDHIMHMAVWEKGVYTLLQGKPRHEGMGIDEETWNSHYDVINAAIQQQHQHMPLDEVLQTFTRVHEQLVEKVAALEDEDLLRPYRYFDPSSEVDSPIMDRIVANTFEHYREHKPWISAIANQG